MLARPKGIIREMGFLHFIMQSVPTVKEIYPWENEWPEGIKNLQSILCPINLT